MNYTFALLFGLSFIHTLVVHDDAPWWLRACFEAQLAWFFVVQIILDRVQSEGR